MDKAIYSETFVSTMFDSMSLSYEKMNTITSFGFYPLWRRQAVKKIKISQGDHVADLMTGIGECWESILKKTGKTGKLTALDFSTGMLKKAKFRKQKYTDYQIEVLQESVFNNSIKSNSLDAVICAYGMKTFTEEQIKLFSKEINRILKSNGQFSLVDVSMPRNKWLQKFYLLYISKAIPLLSKWFAKGDESYKMLGIYSRNFKNAKKTAQLFAESGLYVNYCEYFFGCATGIYGSKP